MDTNIKQNNTLIKIVSHGSFGDDKYGTTSIDERLEMTDHTRTDYDDSFKQFEQHHHMKKLKTKIY